MNRSLRIALGLVLMAGCIDRDGLDIVDGGGGGTGGNAGGGGGSAGMGGQTGGGGGTAGRGGSGGQTGGSGGQTGGAGGVAGVGGGGGRGGSGGQTGGAGGVAGAGGSRMDGGTDGPFMCPPVCAIFCPYGNVLDSRGCPTCQCKPPPMCPPVACDLFCKYGYQKDPNGCELCKCNPPPMCQPVACKLLCPNGFEKDAQGCEICKCAPTTCGPAECGPPPPGPICPPGSMGSGGCERTPEGKCAWNFRCSDDCSSARDLMSCAIRPACRWLEPGCAEPRLSVAGCYARALVDCNENSCPAGRTCLKRTINSCNSTAAAGAADTALVAPPGPGVPAPILPPCNCGQPIGICL